MSRALEVMKIFLLLYMCHLAMGLTYCYKTTFYCTVYNATPHTFTVSEIPWQLVALTLKTLKKSKSGNVLNVKKYKNVPFSGVSMYAAESCGCDCCVDVDDSGTVTASTGCVSAASTVETGSVPID